MATRSNMGYGGGLPTGRAPMVLDLSHAADAISQRMIRQQRERLAMEKSEIDKNEAAILKALDFETVQGVSDEVQRKHLENLSSLWDNWAKKFAENDGKLGMPEMAELMKDKRQVEGKLAVMQTDVKEIAAIREIMVHPEKYPDVDVNATLQKYKDYIDKGKVGTGGAFDILTERKKTAVELIQRYFPNEVKYLEKRNNQIMADPSLTPEDRTRLIYDNNKLAEEMYNAFLQNPEIAAIASDKDRDQFMGIYSYEYIRDKPHRPYSTYGSGSSKVVTERSAETANNILEKFIQMDEDTVNSLKGKYLTGFGTISSIDRVKRGDGYEIVLKNTKGETKPYTINPNLSGEDRREAKIAIGQEILPLLMKSQYTMSQFTDRIEGDWSVDAKPAKLGTTDMSGIDYSDEEISKWIKDPTAEHITADGLKIKNSELLANYIKEIAGETITNKKTNWFGNKKIFVWGGKEYDLKKPADRDALMKKIQDIREEPRAKGKNPVQKIEPEETKQTEVPEGLINPETVIAVEGEKDMTKLEAYNHFVKKGFDPAAIITVLNKK